MWPCALLVFAALARASVSRNHGRQSVISDDSYFYGQSPPVYPSPLMDPKLPGWVEAVAKAQALVAQMTTEEKANITVGVTPGNRCSGKTGSVARLGFPGLCTTGAGNGIRQTDLVNGWPAGIHIGATFSRNVTYQRAHFMGYETKMKGSNALGGPVIGPLGRMARHGRNWEGFSNDPYLAGQLSALSVKGIQAAGVMSMSKHYVGYEQQTIRLPKTFGSGDNATTVYEAISANANDRALHELYLWPFADSIRAGTACIMCSYNRLNNSYACQNSKALNGILKTELGFSGWVVSDWGAQYSGVGSVLAGLDVAMPDSDSYWGKEGTILVESVKNGSVSESRLDDMAMRILTPWYLLGQDQNYPSPHAGLPADFTAPRATVDARNPAARPIVLQGAIEGQVLVKNVDGALPLKKPRMISIYGYDAPAPSVMNVPSPSTGTSGSLFSNPWTSGFLSVKLDTFYPIILGGTPGFKLPSIAELGTLITGGGSGATAPSYVSSPFEAISQQAYEDGTAIFYDFNSTNPDVDSSSDTCLVFIKAWATEGMDRPELRARHLLTSTVDDYSDGLVLNVASKCNNTIVTIHNAGIRLVDQWIDHPNITAVLFAHLPGQDSGRAIKSVLYGNVSPSGRLPYTIAKNESDYGPLLLPFNVTNDIYAKFPQANWSEGLYIDYRYFDEYDIKPRFEFGFGLSYTTFEYSNLQISLLPGNHSRLPPSQDILPGGNPTLYEEVAHVSATVSNNGRVEAAEVAQLYISIPGDDTPMRQLRGFDKKLIAIGDSATMEFALRRKDLSVWDVVQQDWVMRMGEYQIFVGRSSRDLPLKGVLIL